MLPQNNNALNFIETGEGETTLVFLHYFGGSSNAWRAVIDELKKSFHCIAINLRGFGNSPAPVKELSVNDNANDVIQLIQSLQLKKFVLIGHSMGGKIALSIASKKPAELTSLILIAPSPPTAEPTDDKTRREFMNTFGDRYAIEKLIKKITAAPLADTLFEETVEDHLKVSHTAWNGWIEKGSQEDISSQMTNIDVPVFVISGASDQNFSTSFLRTEFIKYFPTAHFEEMDGSGHLLPVEVPLAVAVSIQKYAVILD